jgi:RHS repeat-associated protein
MRSFRFILAISVFGFIASVAHAQVPDSVAASQVPIPGVGHHYIGIGAETVNPADGSLSFDLPLQPPSGRGLSFPFGIHYNASERFSPSGSGPSVLWMQFPAPPFQLNGWNYQLPVYTASAYKAFYATDPQQHAVYCDHTHNYVFRGFDGVQRNLGLQASWPDAYPAYSCSVSTNSPVFADGFAGRVTSTSGWPAPPFIVGDPSGTTYQFPSMAVGVATSGAETPWGLMAQTITDRNGNQINFTGASNSGTSGSYNDTVGRQIVSWSGIGSSGGDQLSVAGLGGNVVVYWTQVTESFPESGQDVQDTGVACSMTANQTSPKQIAAVSEIDIPGNPTQKYLFSYDPTSPYGRPTKITFPGRGYVRYVWGLNLSSATSHEQWGGTAGNLENCTLRYDTPAITDRFVSYDGVSEVLHQQFRYSTTSWDTVNPAHWLTKSTTVTSTDLVTSQSTVTKYNYVPGYDVVNSQIPVEQQIVYQDGSGGTLKTVNKTWSDVFHEIGEQTILDNGQGSATLRCYNSNGQVSDIYEYGFQSEGSKPADPSCATSAGLTSAMGPLKRHKGISYAPMGSTNILNRPCDVSIFIPAQTSAIAETQYFYDGSLSLCGSPAPHATAGVSGLVSGTHDELNYGPSSAIPRGNTTRADRICKPSCGHSVTSIAYDETGQAISITDPNGNVTQYSYLDKFSDAGPSGNTNAYVTQITRPTTNGISHIETYKYAYSNGQPTLAVDQNLQQTQYIYNDPLQRLTETDYPDGGKTIINYNDATYNSSTPSPSVTTTKLINTVNLVSISAMDGLGHAVQIKLLDPNCSTGDITDSTYDGFGRVRTVSNPYCSTSDPTNGITTYSYDALGRTKSVTHPDGTSITTNYIGRATQVFDEGNGTQPVTRISQIDGLGRLASVCEVASGPFIGAGGASSSSLIGSGGTPASCGLDISGTGFLTSYQYDVLDNLLQVTQPGVGLRKFTYDSLSRLMSATNPESGATCYGTVSAGVCTAKYDFNGNLITKTDARGITTTFSYDALNRLLTKVYSDGTPGVTNTYDVAAVDGLTLSYPVGRLVKTATADLKTATVNSYEKMGRIKNQWQCTPQNCGAGYFSLPYTYDFLGDIISAGNGEGVTIGYGPFNGAAELTTVTSTLSDANHPATLFSNPTYTPFGAISNLQLGNGITEKRAYNTRLSLQSLAATDPNGGSATPGAGAVTLGGSEQSKIVQTQAGAAGTGTVTIGGPGEQSISSCRPGCSPVCSVYCIVNTFDSGTVAVTVNGFSKSVTYSNGSTFSSIASALVSAFNGDSASPVTASPNGSVVIITAKVIGAATNYTLSTSVTYDSSHFSQPSFTATPSGSNLTGGKDAAYITVYDSGTISVTVNGSVASSYNYGQTDTAPSIAAGLVSNFSSSFAHASSVSGSGVVTITANTTGAGTNYPLSTSAGYDSAHFASPSFTAASGAALTGGSDNTIYTLALSSYAPDANVLTANDSVNGNWTFTYDAFNRVVGANQNSGQSVYNYVYDVAGNRWQQNGPHTMILTFSATNNRADGHSYDLAGNLLNDGSTQYTYDAESRIITAGTSAYIYDANGRRVRKTVAGGSVDFLYDLDGHEITEVSSGGVWNRGEIYAGSRHLATYDGGTTYFNHSDWLGTERVRSNVSGVVYETCTSLVFGDWLTCSGGDPSPMHFTGKEHDFESGLDYFGARFDASSFGRFMTPDPLMASGHASNPQTWNRYSYALNNPVRLIDPDGMEVPEKCAKNPQCSITVTVNVIWDQTANNGKGLTNQQKEDFKKNQIQKAIKDYAKSNIQLQVTYSEGSFTVDKNNQPNISGMQSDAVNVVASSQTLTGSPQSVMTQQGDAVTLIPVNDVHENNAFPLFTNTIEHELGHHFLGHTSGEPGGFFNYIGKEFSVDGRVQGQGMGVSQQGFREGLEPRRYANPTNPEANKPQSQ